jgi:hypothetical protein
MFGAQEDSAESGKCRLEEFVESLYLPRTMADMSLLPE